MQGSADQTSARRCCHREARDFGLRHEKSLIPEHVAFLGDYVPRRCGIATFIADICEAIAAEYPSTSCFVGSVNDCKEGYDYNDRVRFEIEEQEIASYHRAAEFLNINNVEVLCVQHEFGIYGGPAGSHVLALLRRFRNFMSYSRQWLEVYGSEDSHARALWAVATALGRSEDGNQRNLCALLFQRGLPPVGRFSSPRAWAFTLIAIHEYLRMLSGDRFVNQMRDTLTTMLVDLFRANASPDWVWFERTATYDNAKLSHAMILSGYWTSQGDILEIGLSSLRWLLEAQTSPEGHFTPIGCHGFWIKGGEQARFDQQPVEAHATISACLEAYSATGDDYWLTASRRCFEWFLGRNDLGESLYDVRNGGCRDALLQDQVNQNQGAESTLAFHLSHVEILRAEKKYTKPQPIVPALVA